MKAEEWLRLTLVVKVRNKLASWTRDDVVAYANQEYGSSDLTKQQVAEFVEKLKVKNLEKPGKQYYPTQQVTSGAVPVEFRLKPNLGHTEHEQTHWYLSSGRAELRFASVRDAVRWALDQVADEPRITWVEHSRIWKETHRLKSLDPESLKGYPLSPDLEILLKRQLREAGRMQVALPDNATLRKQYWGLAKGDRLTGEEGELEVTEVRANLDTPPTVTLKKVM